MVRKAVLVGVTSMDELDPARLESVPYDVRGLSAVLKAPRQGQGEAFHVESEIYSEASDRNVDDLLRLIDFNLQNAKHFLFYFSGHAKVNSYGLVLLTPEKEFSYDSGIYFDVLLHRFNQAPADVEVTVILDCCSAGAAGNSSVRDGFMKRYTHLRDGITILASSLDGEDSDQTGDGPSVFTSKVIECLTQHTGETTDILDVYKWVKERIATQTPVLRTFGSKHSPLRWR